MNKDQPCVTFKKEMTDVWGISEGPVTSPSLSGAFRARRRLKPSLRLAFLYSCTRRRLAETNLPWNKSNKRMPALSLKYNITSGAPWGLQKLIHIPAHYEESSVPNSQKSNAFSLIWRGDPVWKNTNIKLKYLLLAERQKSRVFGLIQPELCEHPFITR